MGRRQKDSEPGRWALLFLFLLGTISCCVVYICVPVVFNKPINGGTVSSISKAGEEGGQEGECCRGIEHLELWGNAVKWGSVFKFNSSEECCRACKVMCGGEDGPCLCDSWVFCGNKEACGPRFGECWLKKQKDTLNPDQQDSGDQVIWTSGLIFGKGKGIVGLKTEYGIIHIKLFPDCAPHSIAYILELLPLHHCAGCKFYRAESRGSSWDSKGNHIETLMDPDPEQRLFSSSAIWNLLGIFDKGIVGLKTEYGIIHIKLFPDCAPHSIAYILELLPLHHCAGCKFYRAESRGSSWDSKGNHIETAPFGPPFALIQGTLEAQGTMFKDIPTEACPTIRRGSVAWVGSGPEFFISLANHTEWRKAFTVFGSVLPEDMEIVENIAQLPTKPEVWSNINVCVLEKPVDIRMQRMKTSENLEFLTNMDADSSG
ncbi:Peptidyl-prolyl cis-trans isomerase-like 3 [Morella rubra]|uniref:Peptidyl-prolyl cis-trans isomerase-like 3 n=1 Tax=Morella rubra TaxID=262757 RepID=A0A6A1WSJ4_9ROSI|nr:Peptidyl-prolyl cis-trans isomerase-like 3 [Morella rubra]